MIIDLTKKSYYKYLLFGSLYITEGIHISIAWVLTPLYLLNTGYTPEIITLSSGFIMIPWIGKFIFGYYVDRYAYKGRKSFIIYGGLTASLTLALIPFINPETSYIGFILLLFTGQIGVGFLDLAVDAWAITITKKHERGKLSGSMTIGLYAGMLLGSAILTPLADTINFPTGYLLGGIIILPITLSIILIKEHIKTIQNPPVLKPLFKELKKENIILFLIFLPLVSLNSGIVSLVAPLYLDISLHLSVSIIGLISALFSISRAAGSFILGAISDIHGRKKTLILTMTLTIITTSLLIVATNQEIFTIIYAIIGFLIGGLFSIIFALSMDKTNPNIAALQFGVFMAVLNLGELSGGAISGTLINTFTFPQVFLYAAWAVGPALLLFYIIKKT